MSLNSGIEIENISTQDRACRRLLRLRSLGKMCGLFEYDHVGNIASVICAKFLYRALCVLQWLSTARPSVCLKDGWPDIQIWLHVTHVRTLGNHGY